MLRHFPCQPNDFTDTGTLVRELLWVFDFFWDVSILISNIVPVFFASIAYCILIISQKPFLLDYTYTPKIEVYICACSVPIAALVIAL